MTATGSCTQCGWPLPDPELTVLSRHRSADGELSYLRCTCGALLVEQRTLTVTAVAAAHRPGP